jgi:hypothetical protein
MSQISQKQMQQKQGRPQKRQQLRVFAILALAALSAEAGRQETVSYDLEALEEFLNPTNVSAGLPLSGDCGAYDCDLVPLGRFAQEPPKMQGSKMGRASPKVYIGAKSVKAAVESITPMRRANAAVAKQTEPSKRPTVQTESRFQDPFSRATPSSPLEVVKSEKQRPLPECWECEFHAEAWTQQMEEEVSAGEEAIRDMVGDNKYDRRSVAISGLLVVFFFWIVSAAWRVSKEKLD